MKEHAKYADIKVAYEDWKSTSDSYIAASKELAALEKVKAKRIALDGAGSNADTVAAKNAAAAAVTANKTATI